MDTKKTNIVLVDDNKEFVSILCTYLSTFNEFSIVGTAYNGVDAIDVIKEKQPDVVILDIVMPHLDGIGVLKRINDMQLDTKPIFIILSVMGREETVRLALSLGASYFIIKPFDLNDLVMKIRQHRLGGSIYISDDNNNIESKIEEILNNFGMPSNLKGYKYLIHAISLVYIDISAITSVTKYIYDEVSKKFNTTPFRVERAIRNAIEVCFSKGNLDVIDSFFDVKLSKNNIRPTNSEFITVIVNKLRK